MPFINPLPNFSLDRCHHIISQALADWAKLDIDPSGTLLPSHLFEIMKQVTSDAEQICKAQDEEQEQRWYENMSKCYLFFEKLAHNYDVTFSTQSIEEARAYLANVNHQTHVHPYPYDKARHWLIWSSLEEQIAISLLVEPMLNYLEEQAFYFMKCVLVDWLAQLNDAELYKKNSGRALNHRRGYVLYLLMIDFEH